MKAKNLAERYDCPLMDWSTVVSRLDAGVPQVPGGADGPGRHTCWLTTINADGSPHANALGMLWDRGSWVFVTGPRTRRGRNLERDPRCLVALSLRELDLVVEGRAERITEADEVARIARRYATEESWPCEVDESGAALTAPYSAQSAGPPPWWVHRVVATSAHAVETVEPHGATRWTF